MKYTIEQDEKGIMTRVWYGVDADTMDEAISAVESGATGPPAGEKFLESEEFSYGDSYPEECDD